MTTETWIDWVGWDLDVDQGYYPGAVIKVSVARRVDSRVQPSALMLEIPVYLPPGPEPKRDAILADWLTPEGQPTERTQKMTKAMLASIARNFTTERPIEGDPA